MSTPDADTRDEQFAELLAAYEEARANGQLANLPVVPADLADPLREAGACLDRLWPHPTPPTVPAPVETGYPFNAAWFAQVRLALPASFGRFRLEREIGRGGEGIVFQAFDPTLGRTVALKVPRPDVLAVPQRRERFLREARAAARLDHPNVVPVHEVGEVGPVAYLASAYCEGPTLAAWLRRRGEPVPVREAAALVAALADGVEHAHRHGVLHRDLKPANVLLQPIATKNTKSHENKQEETTAASANGRFCDFSCFSWPFLLKITDFGLAKLLEDEPGSQATATGAVLGTPAYMAPEQAEARSRHVGPATDVYALGVILYEVLIGRPPLVADTELGTLRLVLGEEPVPPRRLRSDIPRDLEAICLKCLEKEPRQRYPAAAGLAQDLQRFLRGEPTRARPVGTARRTLKWARRRPAVAALIAVSALALLGLLAGAVYHFAQQEKTNSDLEQANRELSITAAREHRQALHLRRLLYANEFKLSVQAWHKGQPAQVVEWLDAHRPLPRSDDLRGFEWYYLKGLCHPLHAVWRRHPSSVLAVAVSPDGRTVASGGSDRTVRLSDAATGQERAVLTGHRAPVAMLAVSPDGRTLASGSDSDREVRLWDLAAARERFRFTMTAGLLCFAFTPDGKQLLVGTPAGVGFRDAATGRPAPGFLSQPADPLSLVITPDGRTAVTGNTDATVRLWDLPTGRPRGVLRGNGGSRVWCVAIAPDGRTLASAGDDQSVRLWDPATGALRATLHGHRYEVRSLAFAPDSRTLASAAFPSDGRSPCTTGEIKRWDVATGVAQRGPGEHWAGRVHALAFLPPGRLLVLGCADNSVQLLDTRPGPGQHDLPGHAPHETWALAFSPDGRTLASAGDDHHIRLWDPASGRERAVLQGHGSLVCAVAFSPDGRTVASASYDHTVKLWDAATGRLHRTLNGPQEVLHCVAFAPDGRTLAAGGRDTMVRLWDPATGRALATLAGHTKGVRGVAFSPDGRVLASAGEDGKVHLWDPDTGRLERTFSHSDQIHCLAFAPNSKTLACGNEVGVVRLWDVAAGRQRASLKGHVKQVFGLAFAPDGRTLATAGDDKTVRLWQAATGAELLVLEGHVTRVNAVAFSPEGRTLASTGHDGAVKLWRTAAPSQQAQGK
jgi:WD40 repeat protein/serine/threonine protein kinase